MPVDYSEIIRQHGWIVAPRQKCILSPDSDGFLCGLLMSNILEWTIEGFYDGKVLLVRNGVSFEDCVFVDMDINRVNIKSIGHHMVIYNKRISHSNQQYSNCIQPNMIRGFDGKKDFQKKYPFGTIHLLLGIIQQQGLIQSLNPQSLWPLLFTDGVWNNLFGYTENCLDWIQFLRINDSGHILNSIFCSSNYSFYEIMNGLNDFLRMRDNHNAQGYYQNNNYHSGGRKRRTGDKLRISGKDGDFINLEQQDNSLAIHEQEKNRIVGFISNMGEQFGFHYIPDKWRWDNLQLKIFRKNICKSLNNTAYLNIMDQNPFSMAMTSGTDIEYTLVS